LLFKIQISISDILGLILSIFVADAMISARMDGLVTTAGGT
jgi:hypothetical protein